jgi:hypothetical protein
MLHSDFSNSNGVPDFVKPKVHRGGSRHDNGTALQKTREKKFMIRKGDI